MTDKKRVNMHLPDELYQQIKIMSMQNKRTFTDEVIYHLKAVVKPPKPQSKPRRARSTKEQDVISLVHAFTKSNPQNVDTILKHCAEERFDEGLVIQVLQDYSKDDQDQEFRAAENGHGETQYRTVLSKR